MKKFIATLILTTVCIANISASEKDFFRVKYISSEHVYIDAGVKEGLEAGTRLIIISSEMEVAEVEVVYTAENSSSCKIINKVAEINKGDLAKLKTRSGPAVKTSRDSLSVLKSVSGEVPKADRSAIDTEKSARIRGNVAVGFLSWNDRNSSDLDFRQPWVRLKITASDLLGSGYFLKARLRSRYNQRSKRFSANVPENEWRNKIYEFSFGRGGDFENGFRIGRIIPNSLSGTGYIDGILIQKRLSNSFKAGVFGGTQPEWQYARVQSSIQKYGLYLSVRKNTQDGWHFTSSLALAAEYHLSTVSREFLHFKSNINRHRRFSVYQSIDIDINRSWRMDKANEKLSISNYYFSSRYRFNPKISAGLTYDNRKRYWTYELRSLADSLFDDLARRGLKTSLTVKLPGNINLNSSYGLRMREGEQEASKSYYIRLNKSNIPAVHLSAGIQVSVFSNLNSDGLNLSYNLGKYFRRGDYLILNIGSYEYKYGATNTRRSSRWIQLRAYLRFMRTAFLSAEFQSSSGDDIEGYRIISEIGYNFR